MSFNHKEYPDYINLELNINFTNEKTNEIINAITGLLESYGYEEYSTQMGPDDSGVYEIDKMVFFPKECL